METTGSRIQGRLLFLFPPVPAFPFSGAGGSIAETFLDFFGILRNTGGSRQSIRKSVMSIKIPPAILGQKWLRQFYGRLAFSGSFCWKTPMPIKFLLLGGVLGFFRKGGWKCQFYFYGHGDFSESRRQNLRKGNANLFKNVCSRLLCPLTPPPLSQLKVMDFLLKFDETDLKQYCEDSAKIANKLSQHCEQTEL